MSILQIWITWASKITLKNLQLCSIKIKGSHTPGHHMQPLYNKNHEVGGAPGAKDNSHRGTENGLVHCKA